MESRPQPYECLFLVCTNQRPDGKPCCLERGSEAIKERLKAEVKARGLKGRVRVSASGCLDQCSFGPNIFVFPEGIWHLGVQESDIPEILARHLPVEKFPPSDPA